MDRAALPVESMDALELRVLQGPQSGARAPLTAGMPCLLAAGPDGGDGADIVLREPGVAPTRVRVSADAPHAILEVLQGEVQLGGETLQAGSQTLWPMHAPLHIGALVVAFGRACVDHWPSPSGQTDGTPAADPATSPPDNPPLRRRAEVWLAAMGAGVLVVCAAALWIAHAAAAAPAVAAAPDAAALSTALRGTEFATLQAVRGADGALTLRGRLATDSARQKLDAWLLALGVPARVDVVVDESVAREVAEVFRVNGVAVKATVAAPGRIDAEAAERDAERLARAEEVVRRDVRGLEQLAVRNTAKPLPLPMPPISDDPGKRIASLITSEPAYLVTADGSRYFVGALLPSGHRVARINPGSVTLELHGQQTTLNF
jgi:type III secretion protein D